MKLTQAHSTEANEDKKEQAEHSRRDRMCNQNSEWTAVSTVEWTVKATQPPKKVTEALGMGAQTGDIRRGIRWDTRRCNDYS